MRVRLAALTLAAVNVPFAKAQFGMPPKPRSSPVKGATAQLLHRDCAAVLFREVQ